MNFVEIDSRDMHSEWSMSELQSHEYFELYFLLEGTRRLFLGDKIYTVNAPKLSVIPPFCMHKTEGDAYRRINLNVSPGLLSECELESLSELSRVPLHTLDKGAEELLIPLLESALVCNPTPRGDDLALSYTHVILHLLTADGCLKPCNTVPEAPSGRQDEAIKKIIEYINKHYREDFSIDLLCRTFFISKNTLSREFHALMRCSVMEYRTFVRISRAKELLAEGTMSMEKIAEECGFSSANYFSLIFKRNVGIAPTYYRKSK